MRPWDSHGSQSSKYTSGSARRGEMTRMLPLPQAAHAFYNMHCEMHVVSQIIKLSIPFHLIAISYHCWDFQKIVIIYIYIYFFSYSRWCPGLPWCGCSQIWISLMLWHSSYLFYFLLLRSKVSTILLFLMCNTHFYSPMISITIHFHPKYISILQLLE